MSSNNQLYNIHSSFAESAYAHAEASSSSLYYEGDTNTVTGQAEPTTNIVHAEFQPLAGASVIIITNTSKSDKVTDARTLGLMEERESVGSAVEGLGGTWVSTLDDGNAGNITHAIWINNEEDEQRHPQDQLSHLSSETLVKLNACVAFSIPVVSPNWLSKIGELLPGQHWSDANVEHYIPRIIKRFHDNINSAKRLPLLPKHGHSTGRNVSSCSRRDSSTSLSASISETYQLLIDENPDAVENEAFRRAMELSMLDFAIVNQTPTKKSGHGAPKKNALHHEVLKVPMDASPAEIKMAYRRRALETHPDKGGKPGEFEAVARAYRCLLNAAKSGGIEDSFSRDEGDISLKSTSHWDTELKEHRNLVRELYAAHGQDISDNLQRQNFALEQLGMSHKEAGSRTYNEKNEEIRNSCFYLSLASSYLSGIGALDVWNKTSGEETDDPSEMMLWETDNALIKETALQLKRVIEAAVLSAHPEWAAKGMVGEEVQAFSDFLVYILESQTIISDWAVVVFDTCSGFVDIYKGNNYKDEEEGAVNETYAASNTLTLRFVPGHYQPLMVASPDLARPTLKQIVSVLDDCGVLYVVTDGSEPEKQN